MKQSKRRWTAHVSLHNGRYYVSAKTFTVNAGKIGLAALRAIRQAKEPLPKGTRITAAVVQLTAIRERTS